MAYAGAARTIGTKFALSLIFARKAILKTKRVMPSVVNGTAAFISPRIHLHFLFIATFNVAAAKKEKKEGKGKIKSDRSTIKSQTIALQFLLCQYLEQILKSSIKFFSQPSQ